MIIRMAVFSGTVAPELSEAFQAHVQNRMLPLIADFPGLLSVRVLRTDGGDGILADAVLALEMSYPDTAAMDLALASPQRAQNAIETEAMLTMVTNPTISHTVFHVVAEG